MSRTRSHRTVSVSGSRRASTGPRVASARCLADAAAPGPASCPCHCQCRLSGPAPGGGLSRQEREGGHSAAARLATATRPLAAATASDSVTGPECGSLSATQWQCQQPEMAHWHVRCAGSSGVNQPPVTGSRGDIMIRVRVRACQCHWLGSLSGIRWE
jgi:hypothetical protein